MLRAEAGTAVGALDLEVALAVGPGRCLALAGPSGAGKTTVLRIVAGLVRPFAGTVACGEEVWLDTERGVDVPPEGRAVGYVFQEYALFGHLRAWQNVAYPLRGMPRAARRRRAGARGGHARGRGPVAARDPRLRRGGPARRPRRGHRRGEGRPGGDAGRARRRAGHRVRRRLHGGVGAARHRARG